MKFKEYTYVRTLVDRGSVKKGEIGYIIDVLTNPCEGYTLEFSQDGGYEPRALETYDADELEEIKK